MESKLKMQNLVIVESPAKCRTLSKFLGPTYQIEASMGHVRDLPKSEMGIDIKNDFQPSYIIPKDKRKRVNQLRKIATTAKILWLATDPDREGEAIAWHILQLLDGKKANNKRIVFHEITSEAVKEAFKNPRQIDLKLVNAQQARRVLDRLVGYKLSPLLWKKVKSGLSAGRVQSVALRLVVEREKEIENFKSEEYWSIEASLRSQLNQDKIFGVVLAEQDGKKLSIKNKKEADWHVAALLKLDYKVLKVTKREVQRSAYPPFTTSTLQQVAAHLLGFSSKKTMSMAQYLYEHGFLTYIRTDSLSLAASAISQVRTYIEKNIGKTYLPISPKRYKTKSKLAQEAHEAIRPTDVNFKAEELKSIAGMNRDHIRLYELIWKRMVACQMSPAILDQTTVDVSAGNYLLKATGTTIKFDGWMRVSGKAEGDGEKILPDLSEGEKLDLLDLKAEQHFTQPPPRYTEATLIKRLEELGIGRPSTYAPILSTIQERVYVEKEDRKFVSTPLGLAVTNFLMKYFPDIVDYKFTAKMEDELDDIAQGKISWQPTIESFYKPFEKKVEDTEDVDRVKVGVEKSGQVCPECGGDLVIRYGKFGKFLACSSFPKCRHTESFGEVLNIKCPKDGGDVVVKKTKRGKLFYGCRNFPKCQFASWTKPKTT